MDPEQSRRIQLHYFLETLLGSTNVYFQPPPNLGMHYPCIVYAKDDIDTKFADNKPYDRNTKYQVTVIDPDPDSEISDKIAGLSLCSFERHFTADNLNHDVFNLYF